MHAPPTASHRWLQALVGQWEFENEMACAPGEPPMKSSGTEAVRPLGELWILCEGQGEMPGGGPVRTVMTLGYDPARERFVGTFVASMMAHLWLYEGQLDEAGAALDLATEGPSFSGEGLASYRDVITVEGPERRTLTSFLRGDDGTWRSFMKATYRRTG